MKNLLIISCILLSSKSNSQHLKYVIGAGLSNYSGDIQQRNFTTKQARAVFSLGATYELSNHFLLRSDFSYASIQADDKFSGNNGTELRNLDFKSNIAEWTVMGEYNILDLNYHRWTPYVFAGMGLYTFNPYTHDVNGEKTYLAPLHTEGQGLPQFPERKPYKTTQLNIPGGAGIKYALSEDIHIGGEFSVRKLFTDYLDDVSTSMVDETVLLNAYGPKTVELAFRGDELPHNPYSYPAQGSQRGSPKYKDYYYFLQLRISIRLNWFEGANSGSVKGFGCPTRVW